MNKSSNANKTNNNHLLSSLKTFQPSKIQPQVEFKLSYSTRRGLTWLFLFTTYIFDVYFLSSSLAKENLSDKMEAENRNDKDKPLLAW